jgi:asparagine synthase (glutamine-hydrolysing)
MCGISGIIDLNGIKFPELQKMSAVLKHRGPDDEGFLISNSETGYSSYKGNDTIPDLAGLKHISEVPVTNSNTIGLMHRRLSIIDLSAAGHQPMLSSTGKNAIVFNGEIYNYREIRSNLVLLGHTFISGSDTEVILAAYSEWGMDCVKQFVGMWALAIYDSDKNKLFLSRDRFGIKPLYFSIIKNKFAFASEIKGLLLLDFVSAKANMEAVLEYISFGAASDPSANLFKEINIVDPAHNVTIDVVSLNISSEKYYSLEEKVNNYDFQIKDKFASFKELLENAVDLHLRSDVPVGSALSGGLDSSTLVAMAASKMTRPAGQAGVTKFKTFTAAYHEKEIDESYYAKKVTDNISNAEPFYTHPQISDYWKDIDKLIWHQDLPINSTSMFAQWEVMKLAGSKNIKVLLDGQGADEILGGYYNFAGIHLIELLKKGKLFSFNSERKDLKANFTPNINTAVGRAAYYFLPDYLKRSVRAKKRIGMGVFSDEYSKKLADISVPLRGGKSYRELSLLSIKFGLQELLRYEDRNSMAFSIESRVPFLDHRLVEFCISLENELKIKNGWTKYILRKTAEPILDKEVVWRKDKMGFLTPQKTWKLNSNKELTAFINETNIPSFLNKKHIVKLCSAELNDSPHLSEFWKIISFLKWAEVFKVEFA